MVNIVSCYISMLHKLVKLSGLQPKQVEIEPGTTISFRVPSKSSGKAKMPLVLIHGFAGDGILTWQFQALSTSLRKKFSLYIPDVLFFGESHTVRPERSVRFQADCMAVGLKKLGVENCIVVGFSYGGFVGFEMARNYPELVRSVVITGSILHFTESYSKKALERIGFPSWSDYLLPNSVEGVKTLLQVSSYKLPKLPKFFYKHYLEAMFSNKKEKAELLEAIVIRDEDVDDHQFQQTIHLLWGKDEKIFDMEVADKLKGKLGSETKLKTVKKAGHLLPLERPFAFHKCLIELLESFTT